VLALCACAGSSGADGVPDASIDAVAPDSASDGLDASPTDAARADGGDAGETYKLLVLDPLQCAPDPLPTTGGLADCRVIVDASDGGCVAPGLVVAPTSDVDAINAIRQAQGAPTLAGSVCILNQLSASSPGSGCSAQQSVGWCYVLGSCVSDSGTVCAQDICPTSALSADTVVSNVAYLACP
jgi:hypothetical protein